MDGTNAGYTPTCIKCGATLVTDNERDRGLCANCHTPYKEQHEDIPVDVYRDLGKCPQSDAENPRSPTHSDDPPAHGDK